MAMPVDGVRQSRADAGRRVGRRALVGGAAVAALTRLALRGARAEEAEPEYDVIDLPMGVGAGGGDRSQALAINDMGQVLWMWGAGFRDDPNRYVSPSFGVWDGGAVTDLTPLGWTGYAALGDDGSVVGNLRGQGVRWRPGGAGIEALPGMETDSYPTAVNPLGEVTGTAQGTAIVTGPLGTETLAPPDGYGAYWPAAISGQGWTAGRVQPSRTDDSAQRAALLVNGAWTVLGPAPGGEDSAATDLNDAGQLVGGPDRRGMHDILMPGRAFLFDYATGTMRDLGALPGDTISAALAISNAGVTVGYSLAPREGQPARRRAFRHDLSTGRMVDLNDLIDPAAGWALETAVDVNEAGWIVGQGRIGGEWHGFVLAPRG